MAATFRFDAFVLDRERRELTRDGEIVALEPKQFQLLELLVRLAPAAVARQEIYDALWPDVIVEEANVHNLVSELRRALEDESRTIIRTIHGFGYAFTAELDQPSRWELTIGERRHQLFTGANLVGRNRNAAVEIEDPGVSRRQAILRVGLDCVVIEDLGSKNGTFVRGERISTATEACSGDPLRFGSVPAALRQVSDEELTVTE